MILLPKLDEISSLTIMVIVLLIIIGEMVRLAMPTFNHFIGVSSLVGIISRSHSSHPLFGTNGNESNIVAAKLYALGYNVLLEIYLSVYYSKAIGVEDKSGRW